jgi:CreA protein
VQQDAGTARGRSLRLGLAELRSAASIARRQVSPISFAKPLAKQEEVFNERIGLVFKKMCIVRVVDKRCNTLDTYFDRVIDASTQYSVTAKPVDRATPITVKWLASESGCSRTDLGAPTTARTWNLPMEKRS